MADQKPAFNPKATYQGFDPNASYSSENPEEAYAKEHTPSMRSELGKNVQPVQVMGEGSGLLSRKPVTLPPAYTGYGVNAPNELTGVPESPEEATKDVGLTSTALGVITNPVATGRALLGGWLGSMAGRRGVKALGGGELAQDAGSALGTIGGGVIGAGGPDLARSIFRDPITGEITLSPNAILNRMLRTPEEAQEQAWQRKPALPVRAREEMNQDLEARHDAFAKNVSQIEKARQKEIAGVERLREQDARARMGRSDEPGTGARRLALPGRAELPPTVPEAESVPGAGGEAWSMKRGTTPQLQRAVSAGDPGAINVARRLNPTWRPIIIPKGVNLEAPEPTRMALPESVTPPQLPKMGEGTSAVMLAEGGAPRVNPSQEMASSWHEESRLRSILNDPKATPEERAYASTVLGRQK